MLNEQQKLFLKEQFSVKRDGIAAPEVKKNSVVLVR
jgi:hypothetical protein